MPPENLASRPEFKLLVASVRTKSGTPLTVAEGDKVLDWEVVLSEADRHGLTPLFDRFIPSREDIPKAVRGRLTEQARRQMTHGLMLTARLFELTALLEAAGVDAIPYKGPTLAALAYGDPALRPSVDLDVLVRPEQVQHAKDVLIAAGFRPASYICDRHMRLLMNCVCEYEFTSPDGSYTVEIHWRVVSKEFGIEFPDNTAWSRVQAVPIGAKYLRTLSTEDLLLALAAHGTRHLWNRLLWIADVSHLIGRCSIQWELLIARADSLGIKRTLLLALSLAGGLLGAPVPAPVTALIERDPVVRRLHDRVVTDCIHDPYAADRRSRHRFYLATRESLHAKYSYIRQVALTPQVGDFAGTDYGGGSFGTDSWLRIRGILARLQ